LAAPLVADGDLRAAAVRALLTISPRERDAEVGSQVLDALVGHAESTPAAERTTVDFTDAMQLADQLLASLPVDAARAYRERLRSITVRVVRIQTIPEEMRYDTPYFAVEAGRPVQVVLQNEDLMVHNLVITEPGALKEVAELGLQTGPQGGLDGKAFVPPSEKVLFATSLVEPGSQQRLTFTAPATTGEYPFVCTFPRHWMRMYGVMLVVEDLDAWQRNPTKPKDPIGSNRSFVQSWRPDDLRDELDAGLRSRSPEIGRRLFNEATCVQCHKVQGEGGAVGPELTDVFQRWKGDRFAVLREVLEPSHQIDPKYAVHLIVTKAGNTVSGILQAEDKTTVSLLTDPEAQQPTVIARADIDELVATSTSMMPKALLDRYTKDEIFELLAFLESLGHGGE
jgi:putative heme-binding domain-containing protein